MKIKLIATGGTIEKNYDLTGGELNVGDRITHILSRSRHNLGIKIERLLQVDSLDITAKEREKIVACVQNSAEKNIVITHGTDTMGETARAIGEKKFDKVVILTGAMIPESIAGSYALFNLGCALTAVQLLDKGVYIAMNGKIFNWDNVHKNLQLGIFEEND